MDFMDELKKSGIVPGLGSIKELCRRLGNPQDAFPCIHIAGTNGKGSVLAYLSTVYKTAGYRVGAFSSPAVFNPRETIRVERASWDAVIIKTQKRGFYQILRNKLIQNGGGRD